MPETLKLLKKRSKVKTWFRDIARETVAGDYLPESEESAQQQDSASTSSTVDPFQGYPTLPCNQYPGYPTLPSDESDTEQDGRARNPRGNKERVAAVACEFSRTEIENGSVKTGTKERETERGRQG